MGILNVTPDSMFDGGRYMNPEAAIAHVAAMIQEGAAIIDIGGESTRPNAQPLSAVEELKRVLPIIKAVRKQFSVSLYIDTSKPLVMRAAGIICPLVT